MPIEKITEEQIKKNSMERLSNRPTAASRIGIGGLSPEQLKKAQDALALLAIAKVNELIELINADASPQSIAALIKTPIVDPDNDERYKTLYDVLMDIINGDLAGYLALTGLAADNLQDELDGIEKDIKSLGTTLGTATDTADKLGSVFARLAFLYKIIGTSEDIANATGSIYARLNKLFNMQWGSGNLEDSSVTTPKIADGEVTTPKLADKSVTNAKIADGAVAGTNLADFSVTSAKVAENAVGETKLDNATREKINSPISSVDYNPNTGVLSFKTISEKNIEVDLPLELMISDGYYAKEYFEEREYSAGEYCTREGALYRCTTATSGTFDISCWEVASAQAEAEREIILEMFNGGVIEIPAQDIAGDIVIDSELSETSENPVKNKVIAKALKNINAGIPTFDLIALGLPTVPMDGSTVLVETDTTEIMEALEKGAVKFAVNVLYSGQTLPIEVLMNNLGAGGQYICGYTFDLLNTKLMLTLVFVDGAVQAYVSTMESEKELPEVTAEDNDKFLCVVDGAWAAVALTNLSEEGA